MTKTTDRKKEDGIAPGKRSDSILNPLILFHTLCCRYSLELSQRDNSNEYPQHRV